MPKVNIVIPVYNHYEMTHKQLYSLYRKEFENIDHILVVDDCSPDVAVQEGLSWWKANNTLPLSTTRNTGNKGFLLTSNESLMSVSGFDEAKPDDIIILLSSDVMVYDKFIQEIKTQLDENPKSLVGGIMYTHDTGWNKFGERVYPYLEGWLLATTVAGWHELDYFDERFAPCDFEDVDLSTKAIAKGYELVPLNNPGLVHLGGQSIGYNAKRLAHTNVNKKKFEAKWVK